MMVLSWPSANPPPRPNPPPPDLVIVLLVVLLLVLLDANQVLPRYLNILDKKIKQKGFPQKKKERSSLKK